MTQFANIKDIFIAETRQRREFKEGELQELVGSIERIGLLHPLVLRKEAGRLILVAGERRLRAIKDIFELGGSFKYGGMWSTPGNVPYTPIGELSPIDALEAELEENIRRVDLTWQERAAATAMLMELRQKQAEAKGEVASVTALAVELRGDTQAARSGSEREAVRQELIVAKFLDDSDVAKAGNVAEAFKILKRKEQATRHRELGETIGKNFTSAVHTLVNGDSSAWMEAAAPETFDVIVTDPPYGMGADEFGDSGGGAEGAHDYADDDTIVISLMMTLPSHLFRLAKPQAHCYLFCDVDWFGAWKDNMREAGWKVFRTPLIWYKPSAFRAPWPEEGPQRKYECILYATKGGKKVNRLAPDVLTYQPDKNLGHQAQKPVALFIDLLSRSITPGDSVLDPFCGTGPIFAAAHELKCKATGLELDPTFYGIAAQRIKDLL